MPLNAGIENKVVWRSVMAFGRWVHIAIACMVCHASAFGRERPNVLFLAVDDMNDWIGCLDSTPQAITPNLDRLAARGVNFTNAHTAGVFCAPSRAAIFTGQFASTTGCYRTANYFFDHPEIEPLQVSFSKAGYQTFGAGKLFHHPAGAIDARGWNEFFLRNKSQRTGGWPLDSWSEGTPFPNPFPNSIYNRGQEITGGLFLEWGAIPNEREEEMADSIRINWAVEKLKQKHEQPFFLGVGIYAPHYPNYVPQKYFDLYDPDKIGRPPIKEDDLDDLPPKIRKIKTARSRIIKKLNDLDAFDDANHGYLASISYADAMMGRVLDALEASPYADNTIVVLWSDHGYHHGEKGDWGKHTLWERTSNVPFIWAGPGIASGKNTDATVSLIDMYPTFIDLCDLQNPAQKLEGESLASALAEPDSEPDRDVFLPHMNPGEYAIINRDWRYIRYGSDGEELYDLQSDPNEWNNVASDPAHANRIASMRKAAPRSFAKPAVKLNARKDMVIEGESFRWELGKGNYQPPPKNLPYTQAVSTKQPAIKVERLVGRAKPAGKKKNVLLIVCDDLNTHVSTSGYQPIQTPTLASLAAESMTFQRAYCQYPVCGPSRASLLSGLYPQSTGILNNTADIRQQRPGTVSMPQYMKQSGYWTASVGKVFHSTRHEHGEIAWDEFVRFQNDELPIVTAAREKFEAEFGSIEKGANRKKWREIQKRVSAKLDAQTPPGYGPSGLTDDQHKDGKNARQVAQWLSDQSHGEKPFFIACGIQKPHVPFLAPNKYFDQYPTASIEYTPDRKNLWDSIPRMAISKRYEAFGFKLGVEDDALRREYMQAYHACVSFIDAQLQLVFEALRESGHWDDTIVIFTSDHGYHLGDHFLWGKVTLFDVGAKVPFIIRAPGMTKAGATSQAMVELIDIYPTVVDLTGLPRPEHLQGVSLRPLLGHPERTGRKKYAYSVVSRGKQLGFALRNQRWRYGKWPDGEELYNLRTDPQEKNNLAGKPHVAERLEELRQVLAEKQSEAKSMRNAPATSVPVGRE
ncbi:MAG: sulfatase [Planctomycetota bacterium]